jgi:glycosyltransferase involved in cell wall biosynthesis
MKLAHISPLPPQRSGIADYCAQLLAALAEGAVVDAYTAQPEAPGSGQLIQALPISDFPTRRGDYDAYLYHMGNHPAYHEAIYAGLCRYPGVVVLHDANLHAFFLNSDEPAAYVRAMGYEHGLAGLTAARQVLAGREPAPEARHSLAGRIADVSLGLIVHSQVAARALSAMTSTPVVHIPHGFAAPSLVEAERPELLATLPAGTRVIASFGFLSPSKRLDVVLRTLAHLREALPPFRYMLVGEPVPGYDVRALVESYGLQDVVLCTGYVDRSTFARFLAHTDVGISLRTEPTGGEMSGALLHMMAYGQPVIVSDIGAFAELPAGAVWKIAQDDREAQELGAALRQLLAGPELRRQIGQRACRHVQENHAFDLVARRILSFVQACSTGIAAVSSVG